MKFLSWRWTALAVVLFCVFLAATLPARHLVGWLGLSQLPMQGLDGSPWHGRVDRVGLGKTPIGPLLWQLRPAALLGGRLEYQVFVQSGSGGGELRAGRSLAGPYLSDVQLSLPIDDVARQLALSLARLGGYLLVDVEQARFAAGWPSELNGLVVWQDAQVVAPTQLVLGSLQMQLGLREAQVIGTLGDQGGPLEVRGELRVAQDRRYSLDAQLRPRADASEELRQALGLLGNADAQGRHRLQLSGTL